MSWPRVPAHAEGQKADGSSAWPGPDEVQQPSTAVEPASHIALLGRGTWGWRRKPWFQVLALFPWTSYSLSWKQQQVAVRICKLGCLIHIQGAVTKLLAKQYTHTHISETVLWAIHFNVSFFVLSVLFFLMLINDPLNWFHDPLIGRENTDLAHTWLFLFPWTWPDHLPCAQSLFSSFQVRKGHKLYSHRIGWSGWGICWLCDVAWVTVPFCASVFYFQNLE